MLILSIVFNDFLLIFLIFYTKMADMITSKEIIQAVHPDIQDLLWITDSDNLLEHDNKIKFVTRNYCTYYLSELEPYTNEISTIYSSMLVDFPRENEQIPDIKLISRTNCKTGSYAELTPKQRGRYLQFLQNPYAPISDIGYIFLLYAGLERFLLTDRWEKAFEVVRKLRNAHKITCLQQYSSDVLLVSAILHNSEYHARTVIAESNQNDFNYDLYLYACYVLGITVPDVDFQKLSSKIEKLPLRNIVFFQNVSLRVVDIKIRMISELL